MSLPYPQSQVLASLADTLGQQSISFADSPDFQLEAAGLRLDFSRNLINHEVLEQLLKLAHSADLFSARQALFNGSELNHTERRAVAHTLLRASKKPQDMGDEFDAVQLCLAKMGQWVESVHDGAHRGFSGDSITHVVNLGIGGSDLGPRMVCQALKPYHVNQLEVRFCANVDPSELADTTQDLNPSTTLFIICSKTLSTEETLANAQRARQWLLDNGCGENQLGQHMLAVSSNLKAAAELGIPEQNILPMWDWVGGRYSLWSAIGWSIAFATGMNNFRALLAGAEAMDSHFESAPLKENMPAILSLLEIWYVNFHGARSMAVIPYCHHLRRLPAFLQQLTMESNGKRVNREGKTIDYATAPVLWGDEGTNGQHSFHQLLHQGTLLCPVDFLLPQWGAEEERDGQLRLLANGLAQARALTEGRDLETCKQSLLARGMNEEEAAHLAPHMVVPGNRPCNLIQFSKLDPSTLGALLALYEHRTFCSGHLWQINSFDQYGVELGKLLSADIYKELLRDQ